MTYNTTSVTSSQFCFRPSFQKPFFSKQSLQLHISASPCARKPYMFHYLHHLAKTFDFQSSGIYRLSVTDFNVISVECKPGSPWHLNDAVQTLGDCDAAKFTRHSRTCMPSCTVPEKTGGSDHTSREIYNGKRAPNFSLALPLYLALPRPH